MAALNDWLLVSAGAAALLLERGRWLWWLGRDGQPKTLGMSLDEMRKRLLSLTLRNGRWVACQGWPRILLFRASYHVAGRLFLRPLIELTLSRLVGHSSFS